MSTTEMESRIKTLQQAVQRTRDLRAQAEGKMETLQAQEKQLLAEMKAAGIDNPQALGPEIERLNEEIAGGVKAAADLIPWDLIGMQRPEGV